MSERKTEDTLTAGVLSDREIIRELSIDGSVVIIPFNRDNLSNSSYDITLGDSYYVKNASFTENKYFCPWNSSHIASYWEATHRTAKLITDEKEAKELGVVVGDSVIIIAPGQTILGHTQEFIGGRRNVTTMMKARSSMGRCCVTICKDAGWGDISYTNRYTMEIQNSTEMHLVLIVGQKVGQIVFFRTGVPLKSYDKDGSYQSTSSEDMDTVIKSWKPSDMLPKLKREITT